MNHTVKGAAKRLLFSLAVLASLGGCAVYDTGYGGYGTYGGVSTYDYYGGPVYPAAPVYGYGPSPFYSGPAYVPAPVLQFNYRSGGGYRRHDGHGAGHGWRGGERRFHNGGNRGSHRSQGGAFRGRGLGNGHDRH
jgi:hypothetical protein